MHFYKYKKNIPIVFHNKIVVRWISFETPVNYRPASVSTMREGAALETEAHEPFATDKVTKKEKVIIFS